MDVVFFRQQHPNALKIFTKKGGIDMSIPRPDNGTEWVYMNSNTVYLNATEISHLTTSDVKKALYEMYARHDCIFNDEEMAAYFNGLSWYKGIINEERFDSEVFNAIEKWNVDLLRKEAEARNIRKPLDPITARPASAGRPANRPVSRPAHPSVDPKRPGRR